MNQIQADLLTKASELIKQLDGRVSSLFVLFSAEIKRGDVHKALGIDIEQCTIFSSRIGDTNRDVYLQYRDIDETEFLEIMAAAGEQIKRPTHSWISQTTLNVEKPEPRFIQAVHELSKDIHPFQLVFQNDIGFRETQLAYDNDLSDSEKERLNFEINQIEGYGRYSRIGDFLRDADVTIYHIKYHLES